MQEGTIPQLQSEIIDLRGEIEDIKDITTAETSGVFLVMQSILQEIKLQGGTITQLRSEIMDLHG